VPPVNLLATPLGRKILFTALYFSEGAPIGFLWVALPTRLRATEVPVEVIGTIGPLLLIPWTFKFAWAPLVDLLRSPRWTLRAWVVAMQLLMGLALLPLLVLDSSRHATLLVGLLFAHALAASTQDVAIDALCITSAPEHERGALNGWMQAGFRLGLAMFGGGALWLASRYGDAVTVGALIAAIWSSLVLVLFFCRGPLEERFGREHAAHYWEALTHAVRRRETWAALAFALVSGASFEAVGGFAGPFLVDQGWTQAEAGPVLALLGGLVLAVGAVSGGALDDRIGRVRGVALFLGLIVGLVFTIGLAQAAGWTLSRPATVLQLGAIYFAIGLFTSSSYALFMRHTDPRLGGTQFSAYMAATNACEGWSTFAAGRLVPSFGYGGGFSILALASLASLPLLGALRRRD